MKTTLSMIQTFIRLLGILQRERENKSLLIPRTTNSGEHKEISVFGMQMNLIDHFVGQFVTKEKLKKLRKK